MILLADYRQCKRQRQPDNRNDNFHKSRSDSRAAKIAQCKPSFTELCSYVCQKVNDPVFPTIKYISTTRVSCDILLFYFRFSLNSQLLVLTLEYSGGCFCLFLIKMVVVFIFVSVFIVRNQKVVNFFVVEMQGKDVIFQLKSEKCDYVCGSCGTPLSTC